jgi:hypothetical protein
MKCKICLSETERTDVKGKIYYHCKKCSFIFLDDKFIVSSEKEKQRYLKHQNSIENEGYIAMFEDFINKILQQKKDVKTALDFGSGPNAVLKLLLEKEGIKTDAYDVYFSPEKVFENKKYDLITCTEVFEHLKDPAETMKILKKHLNNMGIIAIMTLFHPEKDEFKDWWYITDETHIAFYNEKTFEHIAKQNGLKLVFSDQKNTIFLELNSKV